MHYVYLIIGIISEVIATSMLKSTDEFRKIGRVIIVAICYLSALFFLTLSLRRISVSVAYAIWSGVGIILVAITAWIFYKQKLDRPAFLGIVLILAGILIINLFSKTAIH
jgi:small multidrug resistance pump